MKEQTKQYDFILKDGSTVTHELTDKQRDCFYTSNSRYSNAKFSCKYCHRCKFEHENSTISCNDKGFISADIEDIIEVQQYEDEVEL